MRIIESLLPILHASEDMKKAFPDKPMVAYRRACNLKDELVRAKVRKENNGRGRYEEIWKATLSNMWVC